MINENKLYTHMEYGGNTSNGYEAMRRSLIEMKLILQKNGVLSDLELRELEDRYGTINRGDLSKTVKVYDYWMYLKIRNITLESYFNKYNYKKIVIYGINYLGNRLYDELSNSFLRPVFGIDKAAEGIEYDMPILSLEDISLPEKLRQIDIVVVTAIAYFQDIVHILLELITINEQI